MGWQVHMDRRCGIWYIFLNGQEVGLKMGEGTITFWLMLLVIILSMLMILL